MAASSSSMISTPRGYQFGSYAAWSVSPLVVDVAAINSTMVRMSVHASRLLGRPG